MAIIIREKEIPPELFEEVLDYLSVHDVNQVARVCKAWQLAANETFRWKNLSLEMGMPRYYAPHFEIPNISERAMQRIFVSRLYNRLLSKTEQEGERSYENARACLANQRLATGLFNRLLITENSHDWMVLETLLNQADLVPLENDQAYIQRIARKEIPKAFAERMINERLNVMLRNKLRFKTYDIILKCLNKMRFLKASTFEMIGANPQCTKKQPEILEQLLIMLGERRVSLRHPEILSTFIRHSWDDEFLTCLIESGAFIPKDAIALAEKHLPETSFIPGLLKLSDTHPRACLRIMPTLTEIQDDPLPDSFDNNQAECSYEQIEDFRLQFREELKEVLKDKEKSERFVNYIQQCPHILHLRPNEYSDALALGKVSPEIKNAINDVLNNHSLIEKLKERDYDHAAELIEQISRLRIEVIQTVVLIMDKEELPTNLIALLKNKVSGMSPFALESQLDTNKSYDFLKRLIEWGVPLVRPQAIDAIMEQKPELIQCIANQNLEACKHVFLRLINENIPFKDEKLERLKKTHTIRKVIVSMVLEDYNEHGEISENLLNTIKRYQLLDEKIQPESILAYALEQIRDENA